MLDSKEEYARMAEVEADHWWYRTLHGLVLDTLDAVFPTKDIGILDAGCGTGGLLQRLQRRGYHRVRGMDLSESAVNLCAERGLPVVQNDLRQIREAFPGQRFDVIVSNDTLYFLQREEIRAFLDACDDLLSPGGLLLFNLPMLEAFRGTHDISVGITRRFSQEDVAEHFDNGRFRLIKKVYWPLLLSPLIFLVRAYQRLRMSVQPDTEIRSDIDLPPPLINKLLLGICRWDIAHLRFRPFGSSLFLALRKPVLGN